MTLCEHEGERECECDSVRIGGRESANVKRL